MVNCRSRSPTAVMTLTSKCLFHLSVHTSNPYSLALGGAALPAMLDVDAVCTRWVVFLIWVHVYAQFTNELPLTVTVDNAHWITPYGCYLQSSSYFHLYSSSSSIKSAAS